MPLGLSQVCLLCVISHVHKSLVGGDRSANAPASKTFVSNACFGENSSWNQFRAESCIMEKLLNGD